MPVKRGNGTSRGINKGLEKKVKQRRPGSSDKIMEATAGKKNRSAALVLAKLAQFVFSAVTYLACLFHAIPMKYQNGVCSLTTAKLSKFLHFSMLFIYFARVANLVYVCSHLIFEEFSTKTLLSFTCLLFYLFTASLSCCNILMGRETVQLVNTWRQVLGNLGEARERQVDMYDDVMLSVKVTGAGGPVVLGPLILCGLPLLYRELPISLAYQMKQVVPEMPYIWTHLACLPFEFLASFTGCLAGGFGVLVFVISIDLVKIYGKWMRRLPLNTVPQHQQTTSMFQFLKVYNAIFNVWYKAAIPEAFFGAASTIVICLYITFRHTHLPKFLYCCYPYVAVVTFFVVFGLCYDGFVGISATEETVGRLRSQHTKSFKQMSQEDRAIALRLSKALRPVVLNVGSFTEFNIGVPLGLWDEILNQLVFLLTL